MMMAHVQEILDSFSDLIYPGLDPFRFDEVERFFKDPALFSLALNKVRGRGVLYGFDHVRLRAALVNDIPKEDRIQILTAKFRFAGLFSEEELSQVVDITDIGMGHSVYKIEFVQKTWVLKPRDADNQIFYCDVLNGLEWPSFVVKPIETVSGKWELSEYLGNEVLGSLFQPGACLSSSVEKELAAHAALGDILGRGDRHFENYVVSSGHLYPIDLSYLFWEDNEAWVSRYISGGMAEFSSLSFFMNDPIVFCAKIDSFFLNYYETLIFLRSQKDLLEDTIRNRFSKDVADYKVGFIRTRLDNLEDYFDSQKDAYGKALNDYLKRRTYKEFLVSLVSKKMIDLDQFPRLKMYYLSDKDRLSAFFLEDLFGNGQIFTVLDSFKGV